MNSYRMRPGTAPAPPPVGLLIRSAALLTGILAAALACADSGSHAPSGAPTLAIASVPAASATRCEAAKSATAIRVCGHNLVDAHGDTVQLRGVNVSGLESVAVQGWSPANPWGGATGTPTPDWKTIKAWGANAVRLPINEASWLGLTCVDDNGIGKTVVDGRQQQNSPGTVVKADPGGNYRKTVDRSVAEASAAGLFVILDLHLSAPGKACPMTQNAMADADHSIDFWTSVASNYKGATNVLFELFNEPFLDQAPLMGGDPWDALRDGKGSLRSYRNPGQPDTMEYPWHSAGMQQMLDAVRATGARNVVLTSTLAYASAMTGWLQYRPTDRIEPSQIAAVWHAYPGSGRYAAQVNCIGLPQCSARTLQSVQDILAAGFPVVLTEFGDPAGGAGAPLSAMLLPFADAMGISYFAWTWDVWPGTQFYLISDATGTPTAGFGTYVKAHLLCRAAGTADCP